MSRCVSLIFLFLAIPAGYVAVASELDPRVVHEIQVRVEPAHSYLVALPEGFDDGRERPVLYLMDARGRAEIPMELFRDAALRRGWIVVSSNDTMSDGPVENNIVALRYLWHDTHERFAIDDSRVYMAGFSGLARFLWNVRELNIPLKGIIGVGAGLPAPEVPARSADLLYYGVVGNRDFNWREVMRLQGTLEELDLPFRVETFDGPHRWFVDPSTAERVLDWMELQELRSGSKDPERLGELFERDRRRAERLLEEGSVLEAAALERWIRRDYAGLDLVDELEYLVSDERYERLLARREEAVREEEAWVERSEMAVRIALAKDGGDAERLRALEMLDAEALVKASERNDDDGAAASRRLAQVRVQLDFYLPRMLLARGEAERALRALQLSASIGDPGPKNRFEMAAILAGLGRHEEALDLLERLVLEDGVSPETLRSERFIPLREEKRYRRLVGDRSGQQ